MNLLFQLPDELLTLIISFLSPRDFQALQCTTQRTILTLYRYAKQYKTNNNRYLDEKKAFDEYQHTYFFNHLNELQHVPCTVLRRVVYNHFSRSSMGIEFFQMMECYGRNIQGKAFLAATRRSTLMERGVLDWGIFLAICVYAKCGDLEQMSGSDERDVAIALVKFSKRLHVQTILKKYKPTTPEMVMCMLHYKIQVDPELLDKSILTQELCDYWIIKIYNPGTKWLLNNLPEGISINTMLACNSRIIFDYATKATLQKYDFIKKREGYTRIYPFFFHGLLYHRKRCGLSLKDLIPVSKIHVECHGTISYLTTRNHLLQRSQVFRPSMDSLRKAALNGDNFFSMWIDKIKFLEADQKHELLQLTKFAKQTINRTFLPYIFSHISDCTVLSYESLIKLLGNCNMAYISCGPK